MKKKAEVEKESGPIRADVLVVGAGPAGLWTAQSLSEALPSQKIILLEAEDRPGGRLSAGLHLVDQESAQAFPDLNWGADLKQAQVRWERAWVGADQVDWDDKEWIGKLPQWDLYLRGAKKVLRSFPTPSLETVEFRKQAPVRKISQVESDGGLIWSLESPEQSFVAPRVIWAAGMTAFQNAFGKQEAQSYLVGNPRYVKEAADFIGGLALDLVFDKAPDFEEGVDPQGVIALPVKHEGRLYLLLAALDPEADRYVLRTLTHVPNDLLQEPKELLSLQKSLKRGLKHILREASREAVNPQEKWVVSPKVGGHALGNPWLLGDSFADGLSFVGDETLGALRDGSLDSAAVFKAVGSPASGQPGGRTSAAAGQPAAQTSSTAGQSLSEPIRAPELEQAEPATVDGVNISAATVDIPL